MERFHCITQLLAHTSPVISRIVFPYSRLTVLVNGPCPCHCLDCRVYTWQWETQTNVKLVYFNHKPVTGRHTYVCTYVHIQICTYIYTYIHTYIHSYIHRSISLVPRPSPAPVLDRLQYAKTEGEGSLVPRGCAFVFCLQYEIRAEGLGSFIT